MTEYLLQLDTFTFALTISPDNHTLHPESGTCSYVPRAYTRHDFCEWRSAALFRWIHTLPVVRIAYACSCALTQPARLDRAIEIRVNVGCVFTISRKAGSTSHLRHLACISNWYARARAHIDGSVTFASSIILVGDCQPCLHLLS
jgi:hypothetical protein